MECPRIQESLPSHSGTRRPDRGRWSVERLLARFESMVEGEEVLISLLCLKNLP